MPLVADGCNVLVFDTKHGTNTHKLKLSCFTTVAPSGATKVLAASLVASESEKSFAWVFAIECLLEAFRIPPAVIFTDRHFMTLGTWASLL